MSERRQPYGQAFWDVGSELLEYHMIPHRPYDSFLQGEALRIDTDKDGYPVFVELSWGLALCKRIGLLTVPNVVCRGTIRFLDLRIHFRELAIVSTVDKSMTCVTFKDSPAVEYWAVGGGAIWGIDEVGHLSELWILGAKADPGGQLRSRWRAESWKAYRLGSRYTAGSVSEAISPISAAKDY